MTPDYDQYVFTRARTLEAMRTQGRFSLFHSVATPHEDSSEYSTSA
jgi:hypothetical protein